MPVDISVESDLKALRRGLSSLEKQAVPQATVRTLNRVAESTKGALKNETQHLYPIGCWRLRWEQEEVLFI